MKNNYNDKRVNSSEVRCLLTSKHLTVESPNTGNKTEMKQKKDGYITKREDLRLPVMERTEGYRGNEGLSSYTEHIKAAVQSTREYNFPQCTRARNMLKDRLYLRL